ncbi:MAG TPA: aldehyde dehydrogenase family protein, partial [Trebonia sp.]
MAADFYTPRGLLVDGEWIAPGKADTLRSPYDGAPIAEVPQGDAALVDRAVAAAGRALRADQFDRDARIRVLDAAVAQLRARHEEFAR